VGGDAQDTAERSRLQSGLVSGVGQRWFGGAV
jgi:hypothetical protein